VGRRGGTGCGVETGFDEAETEFAELSDDVVAEETVVLHLEVLGESAELVECALVEVLVVDVEHLRDEEVEVEPVLDDEFKVGECHLLHLLGVSWVEVVLRWVT
jgi:hypothetical protein